jgi:MSHA pilin protein MshD
MKARARMQGVTLIELIVSIVVISIAVVSVLGALSAVSSRSSEAMLQQQAVDIAAAYLNEILQKPFTTPNIVEAQRNLFNNVDDYNSLPDTRVRDVNGNALAQFNQFTVTVTSVAAVLGTTPAAQMRRIDVTVRHPALQPVVLTGYRARY